MPSASNQAYSGIEFSPDNTRLLVGAVGAGVYWIDVTTGTVNPNVIFGTVSFGASQLGVAYNGFIYAATALNNLQAIDVTSGFTPVLATGPGSNITFTGNAVIANAQTAWTFNNPPIFTLPAEVDGAKVNAAFDLYTKDIPADNGEEPDPDMGPMWISDDIWVRNFNDGQLTHLNPNSSIVPNYVYIRVRNLSCVDFVGTPLDLLHGYWAKAATALSWPSYWDGTAPPCSTSLAPIGGEILSSPQQIPNIPAGGEAILVFPWVVPVTTLYTNCNPEPWHFCLLSRIDSLMIL